MNKMVKAIRSQSTQRCLAQNGLKDSSEGVTPIFSQPNRREKIIKLRRRRVLRNADAVGKSPANFVRGEMDPARGAEAFIFDWLAAAPGFEVLVELKAEDDGSITIERLQTWPMDRRGKGEASRALQTLCQLADLHQVRLCGYAEPYTKRAEDAIRLRLWLARYGFAPATGEPDDLQLYRPPRQEVRPARA